MRCSLRAGRWFRFRSPSSPPRRRSGARSCAWGLAGCRRKRRRRRSCGRSHCRRSAPAARTRLTMREAMRTVAGVVRSLRIYYGDRARRAAMDRLYAEFIAAGRSCVRHRRACRRPRRRLSPARRARGRGRAAARAGHDAAAALRPRSRRSRSSRSRSAAAPARSSCKLNIDNPTVSTASSDFVQAARRRAGLGGPSLEQKHRGPADDARRLDCASRDAGLHQDRRGRVRGRGFGGVDASRSRRSRSNSPPSSATWRRPASSAAWRSVMRDFNAALGESQAFAHAQWQSAADIARWLAELPDTANSGDVYAKLPERGLSRHERQIVNE